MVPFFPTRMGKKGTISGKKGDHNGEKGGHNGKKGDHNGKKGDHKTRQPSNGAALRARKTIIKIYLKLL